jgi:hypothetical protein
MKLEVFYPEPDYKYSSLSVICVVFLWSVSIDKAYLNVLVVVSKLLGQSILCMRYTM